MDTKPKITIGELEPTTNHETPTNNENLEPTTTNENQINPLLPENSPQNKRKTKKKPWKPRKGMSVKQVSLETLHKKMMTILGREIDHLMVLSHHNKLEKDESLALCNYLKLHKQLMKTEDELADGISDEELEKILSKEKPKI